jgi:hypothetical protein
MPSLGTVANKKVFRFPTSKTLIIFTPSLLRLQKTCLAFHPSRIFI